MKKLLLFLLLPSVCFGAGTMKINHSAGGGTLTIAAGSSGGGGSTLTGVAAGTNLTGGGTSGTVTLNLADPITLSSATVTRINVSSIVFQNGTVLVSSPTASGVGTITGVTAGTNLTGGGTSGTVTINLADPITVSSGTVTTLNVTSVKFPNGTILVSSPTASSGGTITGVTAGNGLTGGGSSGSVTLTVDQSTVTLAGKLVAGSNITLTPSGSQTTIAAAATAPAGSNSNVQFNNAGLFGGNSGFQYDSSVSSVTLGGRLRLTDNSGIFSLGDGGSDPVFYIDDENGSPGGGLKFQYGGVDKASFNSSASQFSILVTSDSNNSASPFSRLIFQKDSQKIKFSGTSTVGTVVEFDPVGNSSFTTPVYLSTITINKQLIDSAGSAGSLNQVLTETASGPTWQAAASGSGGYALEPATVTIQANKGITASTEVINSATALGITSGANGARFRMAGILALQNTNTDAPDSSGVFTAVASTSTGNPSFYTARRSSGSVASPSFTASGQNLLQISAGGYGTTNWAASATGRMDFIAEGDFTDSSQPTAWKLSTTPSGSITPVQRDFVDANGAETHSSSHTFTAPVTFSSTTIGLFDLTFDAAQSKLPGSNSPYISNSTGETSASIYFDDTSTQSVTWTGLVTHYDNRTLYADILFTSTATSGTMNWGIYTATQTPNSLTANYDLPVFSVIVTTSVTMYSNSNQLQLATVTLSNTTAHNGDLVTFKLEREAGLSDTAVGFGRVKKLRIYE